MASEVKSGQVGQFGQFGRVVGSGRVRSGQVRASRGVGSSRGLC